MSTEAKTVTAIVIVTILIIIGGIVVMSGQTTNQPTVVINQDILIRPDSPTLKARGQQKVTIVEFADYECPSCAALFPSLNQLISSTTEGQNITLVFRNFPLHGGSVQASVAVQAAGAQGKYWEMHNMVFANQDEWTTVSDSDTAGRETYFEKYATAIGLDINKFRQDIKNSKYTDLIDRDKADAISMHVNVTPTLVIDGKQVVLGAVSYDKLKSIIDAELAANSGQTAATSSSATSTGITLDTSAIASSTASK